MTFIEEVLYDLKKRELDISNTILILPSKRAGTFLRHHLVNVIDETSFAPDIISIEDFVQQLSGLRQINTIELLFQFYETYLKVSPKDLVEPFESFTSWAQVVLQDFNEIDRYLVDPDTIFNYLSAIKELDHWSKATEKTELVTNYLRYWKHLKDYYFHFTNVLLQNNCGYQGLIYREALNNIESYIQNVDKQHLFIGFNALNTAEECIIQELLHNDLACIYWDTDQRFISDTLHSASHFLRDYKTRWHYFKSHDFNWISSSYTGRKSIKIIGCTKSVGQSKYVGTILKQLALQNPDLIKTAVVLGDENLLIPTLNSLPDSVKRLNVTMGFPLKSIPLASLFEQLFRMHKSNSNTFYFKDILALLSHQMIQPLIISSNSISEAIRANNMVYLSLDKLKTLAVPRDHSVLKLLFSSWGNTTNIALNHCIILIYTIKDTLLNKKTNYTLELEYLYRFYKLFNELEHINSKYKYITDINVLFSIYKELLSSETLDFQGEPLDGLQIMGMLESRVLDFDTVIITSVNEGILPAGKGNNSFIPFDVKRDFNLPTFKEKDAVYTYHFYRLLHRAKKIYILYNTEVDALKGGEKSRFITQLEIEGIHNIEHNTAIPQIPKINRTPISISKDENVLDHLQSIARKGFSPSSLTNYIRNPIDFYFDKVLGIKEVNDVEETVAANTLGTVIHNTLQDLYQPILGQFLSEKHLDDMVANTNKQITYHFETLFKKGDITKGKNLIIYEITKRYISNFLALEREDIKKGNQIKIIASELKVETTITVPELNFPVTLKGEIDRIDEYNGVTRIIDYKSGKVLQSNLEVIAWEAITKDYDAFSKAFQILMYTYILKQKNNIQLPAEAGIISFKNLQQGFLKFAKKESVRGQKKSLITQETLNAFETQLHQLIVEICNPEIDFTEKLFD